MRVLLLYISLIIAGCAAPPKPTAVPLPAPKMNACAGIVVGDKCRPITAGTVGGTTLGNTDENILEENSR